MNVPVVIDHTRSGKQHFEVLDGLRGGAAFLIVIFDAFNYSFGLPVCFQMPVFPKVGEYSLNRLYGAAYMLFLFPLVLLCGAHSEAGAGMIRLSKFSGHLSYPLYITHIPVVYVLAGYSWTKRPSLNVKLTLISLHIPLVIFVAWLVLKYYDEPVRSWLSRRYGIK